MSHREPETESIIIPTGGSSGRKCTDLSLISDTAKALCSAKAEKSAGADRSLFSLFVSLCCGGM